MVAQGHTGTKAGKGFYNWTPETVAAIVKRRDDHLVKILKESA
jgi:3-hydroxyacyl-CoA dehydrogenase